MVPAAATGEGASGSRAMRGAARWGRRRDRGRSGPALPGEKGRRGRREEAAGRPGEGRPKVGGFPAGGRGGRGSPGAGGGEATGGSRGEGASPEESEARARLGRGRGRGRPGREDPAGGPGRQPSPGAGRPHTCVEPSPGSPRWGGPGRTSPGPTSCSSAPPGREGAGAEAGTPARRRGESEESQGYSRGRSKARGWFPELQLRAQLTPASPSDSSRHRGEGTWGPQRCSWLGRRPGGRKGPPAGCPPPPPPQGDPAVKPDPHTLPTLPHAPAVPMPDTRQKSLQETYPNCHRTAYIGLRRGLCAGPDPLLAALLRAGSKIQRQVVSGLRFETMCSFSSKLVLQLCKDKNETLKKRNSWRPRDRVTRWRRSEHRFTHLEARSRRLIGPGVTESKKEHAGKNVSVENAHQENEGRQPGGNGRRGRTWRLAPKGNDAERYTEERKEVRRKIKEQQMKHYMCSQIPELDNHEEFCLIP
ncbi:PREDICTED: collagen alpha-1(III) chain-like [Elephantulus edwardii]|uniref:collagen alpha-1(III) chain-like n=1 Tax=Elephantulus edwardii TaxID=28737 RepID=UPI0003F0913A|nr:PREDICTED: collagen alpha-1(III) chain-like [Elephantulus edwardii]